jgi:hypothetical protein
MPFFDGLYGIVPGEPMFGSIKEIVSLLDEAEEARLLAAQITHEASVRDLLNYADALEAEAAQLDGALEASAIRRREQHWSPVLV